MRKYGQERTKKKYDFFSYRLTIIAVHLSVSLLGHAGGDVRCTISSSAEL